MCLIFLMFFPYHNVNTGNIISKIEEKIPAYDKAIINIYGKNRLNINGIAKTSIVMMYLCACFFLKFSKSKKKSYIFNETPINELIIAENVNV